MSRKVTPNAPVIALMALACGACGGPTQPADAGFDGSDANSRPTSTLLAITSSGITAMPVLATGRLGPETSAAVSTATQTVVASPRHAIAYIGSGVYSTRQGRVERRGDIDWSQLAGPDTVLRRVAALSPSAPILGVVGETRPDLLLRFVGFHPETGLPDYSTLRSQSLGRFPYCIGRIVFSTSGQYLWHSKSDCYKGNRFVRLPFVALEPAVAPAAGLEISESEMVGPALTSDDRFALVGNPLGVLKTFALDKPQGASPATPALVYSSSTLGKPAIIHASPGGLWVAAYMDGKTLDALGILSDGALTRIDSLQPGRSLSGELQLLFASENVVFLRSGDSVEVIRFDRGKLSLTDQRVIPRLQSIAIAGY